MEKLPFMATENIMMECRQARRQPSGAARGAAGSHSHAAAAHVKIEGGANDLIDRIAADPLFPITREEIERHLDPAKYVGRAPSQVTSFLKDVAQPVIDRY